MGKRHRQRQKIWLTKKEKTTNQVKTVAKQHTTYGICKNSARFLIFLRFSVSRATVEIQHFEHFPGPSFFHKKKITRKCAEKPTPPSLPFSCNSHTQLWQQILLSARTSICKVLDYQRQNLAGLDYSLTFFRERMRQFCAVIAQLALHGGFWNAYK